MSSVLEAMQGGGAWSVAALVQGLDELHDSEGRPVGERRASSQAKVDVPMVLRACPYPDARNGHPMNVSALAQITRHLDAVLDDCAAFRASLPEDAPPWEAMGMAIYDALGAPAREVLSARTATPTVSAQAAVAHKLALGFFGLLGRVYQSVANGAEVAPTPEGFMRVMQDSRALHGQSEVCAGPLPLIARCVDVLMGRVPSSSRVGAVRVAAARHLCTQYRVGLAWQLLDEAAERWLLNTFDLLGRARPRTPFLAQRLTTRVSDLEQSPPPSPRAALAALPLLLEPALRANLETAFDAVLRNAETPGAATVASLVAHGDGAFTWASVADQAPLATHAAALFEAYRVVVSAQMTLERELRAILGVPVDAPVKFPGVCVPYSWAMEWTQAAVGHRLDVPMAINPRVALCNHHRRVPFGTAAP